MQYLHFKAKAGLGESQRQALIKHLNGAAGIELADWVDATSPSARMRQRGMVRLLGNAQPEAVAQALHGVEAIESVSIPAQRHAF
jgi:hypothetical protein